MIAGDLLRRASLRAGARLRTMKFKTQLSTLSLLLMGGVLAACSLNPFAAAQATATPAPLPAQTPAPVPTIPAVATTSAAGVPQVIATLPKPATASISTSTPTTNTVAAKPTATPGKPGEPCIFKATFVADVNVPDGSEFPPGAQFTKTWRVRNDSNCAWGAGSDVKGMISVDGEKMAKVSTVDFPELIQPGQTIEVSIPMVAPEKAGIYKSEWLFAAVNGASFGVGRNGELPLSAQISVNKNAVPPRTPGAPDANCSVKLGFVGDVTIPDNTRVAAGSKFTKSWRVRNDGTCAWGPGTNVQTLAFAGGEKLGAGDGVALPAIKPGEVKDVSVELTAPATSGTFKSEWKLMKGDGSMVGLGASGSVALYAQVIVAK